MSLFTLPVKMIIAFVLFNFVTMSFTLKTSADCNYCWSKSCTPTVVPADNFNAKDDVKQLKAALMRKDLMDIVVGILTSRSDIQRQQICEEYITTGSTLTDDIKRSVHGDKLGILEALTKPLPLFYTEELHDALESDDYEGLAEILGSLPGCAIREISVYYRSVYKMSLFDKIAAHQWFSFKNLMLELAKGDRDEDDEIDKDRARADAQALIKAKSSWMYKATTFTTILTKTSFSQLKATFEVYDSLRKSSDENYKSIVEDVKAMFADRLRYGYLVIIRNVLSQHEFFARELEIGLVAFVLELDQKKVIRIIRSRSEVDLDEIKQAYKKNYFVSLSYRIERQTDEFVAKALNAVVKD